MTQPGTTGNAIPRGRDWIARDLADLRRMIRRLGANVSNAGGGPISSALYKDPGSPGFGLAYEPSVLVDSFGDASCFNYNGSADIEFLVDGWYQFNVYATVHGATPGDVLHIEGDAGWDGTAAGYGVATGTEYVFLTASSIPFHSLADDGNSIDGRVYNHSGSSGTISAASIYVVRLA